jgi:hypothetical protein
MVRFEADYELISQFDPAHMSGGENGGREREYGKADTQDTTPLLHSAKRRSVSTDSFTTASLSFLFSSISISIL